MNETPREPLEAYYQEAESWAGDRQEAMRTSRRIAWIIAGVAAAVALLEAIALIALMPLKTVVPYTLLVDRQTGHVQGLAPLDLERIAPDTALTQSFLVQYVIARESFDIDAIQTNYRKVALWSAEKARSDYLRDMQANNPQSPLQRYPRNAIVETRVKSVSPLGRNVAMVRFDTGRRDVGGIFTPTGAWVVVIRYRFSTQAMPGEDRYVNPLGFQVLRYQRDAEALPPVQPALPTATAPAVVTPSATVVIPAPSAAPARPSPSPANPRLER